MRQVLVVVGVLAAALALQTTVMWAVTGNRTAVDLVLVAVIYLALTAGPNAGVVIGSLAGLAQDVLSGGVIGVSGLANSVVGCAAGILGTQFVVSGTLARVVVVALGTLVHAVIVVGVYVLIEPRGFPVSPSLVAARSLLNAVVAVIAFQIVDRTPQIMERRRYRRAHVRSRTLG